MIGTPYFFLISRGSCSDVGNSIEVHFSFSSIDGWPNRSVESISRNILSLFFIEIAKRMGEMVLLCRILVQYKFSSSNWQDTVQGS